MPFISISIDICGSTDAKSKLREHSGVIDTKAAELYESFQKQVLRVEDTFWTMLRSCSLEIERLLLIKSIGDEVWYAYDLKELDSYDSKATVARMIEALVSLQTKHFDLVAGPPENPYDWENADPETTVQINMPLKITIDVISEALDIGVVREKYLVQHVASLLAPLGKSPKPVQAGDDRYINLCNRLGIANQIKTKEKVFSSIRSDYIGWQVDRFFRLTKAAIKGSVLIGPEILSDFEAHNLFGDTGEEVLNHNGWSISNTMIRVCHGQNSFTSLGGNYMLARRFMPAEEQKGVGEGCNIGVIYLKHQKDIELNAPTQGNH